MNAHVGLHIHEPWRIGLQANGRRIFAAAAILALAGIGFVIAWKAAHPFDFESFLFALTVTLGPAAAYAFGYFRCMPDALAEDHCPRTNSLAQRWSDFARLTTAFAVPITWICWADIINKNFCPMRLPLDRTPSFISMLIVGMLTTRPGACAISALIATALMAMSVVASEQYLAGGAPIDIRRASGWRSALRRAIGAVGSWLLKHLRPGRALLFGSLLLLVSLLARSDLFEGSGLEVAYGSQAWPTADYTLSGPPRVIWSQVGRAIYIASVIVAVLALVSVLVARWRTGLRKSCTLAAFSVTIALFALCDLTMGVARLNKTVPENANLIVLGIVLLVPLLIWILRRRGSQAQPERSRIAIFVLYLPIAFAGLALVPLAVVLLPGYAFFLIASVLLALGFVQSQIKLA